MRTPTGEPSPRRVILVFGALRSGTTVFRLMLDGHPGIDNPGEVDFLFDFMRCDATHKSGWRYDLSGLRENRVFQASGLSMPEGVDGVDLLSDFIRQYEKRGSGVLTLNIHRNIGRAAEVLPDAGVIHMLRDPRDVARSSIGMGWAGTLYHGVNHWIHTETEWQKLNDLDQSRVLSVKYEDLFRGIEKELRRVCDFLSVPFDATMLDYHKNSTYSPPDVSLVEQWRRKSSPDEIALVEGKAGSLMKALGYECAGAGRHPAGPERLWLTLKNRVLIWKTGIRNFGFATYFLEKLTRYIGLNGPNQRLRSRMRDRAADLVK